MRPPLATEHASYPQLSALARKYPAQAGALFQTFVDLEYAAQAESLEPTEVERDATAPSNAFGQRGWALVCSQLRGRKERVAILPMPVEQEITTQV